MHEPEEALGTSEGAATNRGARPLRRGAGSLEPGARVTSELRLVREIGAGGMSSVWIAEHAALGHTVALKFLHPGQDTTERNWLEREARLASSIAHPHAVRVTEYGESRDGEPFIVMELIDGISLAQRLAREGGLPLGVARSVVEQVADVLATAHAAGVVHRDIKPTNIMLVAGRPDPFVKVIDFGIAKSTRPGEGGTATLPGTLLGTLAYIAPEQLIDERPADFRSDLWGLALVAYEALVARAAFAGRTRAALGSAILLGRYAPVCSLRPELPPALDVWFARALASDGARRFSSAKEMAESFAEACEGPAAGKGGFAARNTGAIALRLPEKLFGRDKELAAAMNSFERASQGRSRTLLVAGYSGVGKTALIRETRQAIRAAGATFVSGKFDPFDRATPYAGVVQALRDLVRHALIRRETRVADEPAETTLDVGDGGHALLAVIPELERLIGPQTDTAAASPEESRNRFQLAVARLLNSLATPAHPLVVFFDDLQWADLPSLDLLENLATDPASRHVLIAGSYRDNEVDASHPLRATIEKIRAARAALDEITLAPLGEDAVIELTSAAFPGSPGRARLAALVHASTRGNAFFVRRLLETLAEEGCLRFDAATGLWGWDLAAIESRPMSDNVVEFVAAEMRRMPEASRDAVAAAACVGDEFDIETLAWVLGVGRSATMDLLRPSLATELIVAAGESGPYRSAGDARGAPGRVTFRFAHDGVRQAARLLIDDARAARVHERAGRFLDDTLHGDERERRLFEIADHLNRGPAPARASVASAELHALNLAVARRATQSAAFASAHQYYGRALELLPDDAWSASYATTLAVHLEGARAAYLSGDLAAMNALVERALAHAHNALDRAAAREVVLHAHVARQQFRDAVNLAVQLLGELGIELPAEPTPQDIAREVGETLAAAGALGSADLARLPEARDPTVAAAQRIQVDAMSSAYMAAPSLLPVMACNIVRSTLASGVSRESPYGFAIFGLVLNVVGRIDASYAMGRLATELLARVGDRAVRPKTLHVVSMHVNTFVEPVRDAVEAGRRVFRLGMDTGDLEYAAWGLHCAVCNGFYAGVELEEQQRAYQHARDVMQHHQQLPALGVTKQFGQVVENLLGASGAGDPARLAGPEYDEAAMMPVLRAINFRGAAFIVTVVGTFLRYLFRDLDGARAFADAGAEFADGAAATYHLVWWNQYRALAILGAAGEGSGEGALAAVRDNVARLREWQGFSPVNHDHRVFLLEAEMARVAGRADEASANYARAIECAAARGFVHEEALARELRGRFHAARGEAERARECVDGAVAAYERWGARAKAARLRAEYPAG